MLKPLDKEMKMTDIRVVKKRGGKSQYKEEFSEPLKAAVLVISDSTYEGTREDKSGKIIKEFLQDLPVETAVYDILPDKKKQFRERIHSLVKDEGFDLVITTGGTGFGPKDLTVEATRPILEKLAPGIAEKIRDYGTQRTPYAMLSREVAGTVGTSLILNLPGSSNGARESMQALFPGVLHIFPMLWGGGHEKPKE
jgi:molybdenum cofactor synthesis domain-containing protein